MQPEFSEEFTLNIERTNLCGFFDVRTATILLFHKYYFEFTFVIRARRILYNTKYSILYLQRHCVSDIIIIFY